MSVQEASGVGRKGASGSTAVVRMRSKLCRLAKSAVLARRPCYPVLWFMPVGPGPSGCSVSGDPHLRETYLCERSVPLRDWPRSVGSPTSPIVRTLVQNWPPFFTKLRRPPGEESQSQVQPAFPGSLRKRNLMWPQRGSQLPPERPLPWGGRGPTIVPCPHRLQEHIISLSSHTLPPVN